MAELADALARLYARVPLGMRLGLDRIEAACARLGSPERSLPRIVHVTGTNGKGSVSAMIAAIGRASGTRTGLYTSPHLAELRERIQIDGEAIDNLALVSVLDRALADPELSFFEATTLAALLAFRDAGVELAVLEVGIGGRLDATSVVRTSGNVVASVITRVALDHQDRLGTTIDLIAREKAAIGVAGVPLVVGPLDAEAAHALAEVSQRTGARVVEAREDVEAEAIATSASLPLPGAHQVQNAHIAAATARVVGFGTDEIVRGLSGVKWPGRLEWIEDGGRRTADSGRRTADGGQRTADGGQRTADSVLLDAAHNPDGAAALRAYIEALPSPRRPRVLVFGALRDKDAHGMLAILAPLFDTRIFVAPDGRAPWDPADLAARHGGVAATDVAAALDLARARGSPVLVCGSIYLVGRTRARLLGLPEDPPVAL